MAPPNDNFNFLNKNALAALMKKMDKDIATRLVVSAVSLDPKKINDAVGIAFQEMAIRAKKKKKQKALEPQLKDNPTELEDGDVEMVLLNPEEEDEDKNS